jgi:polysaccharide export outer membrane protein
MQTYLQRVVICRRSTLWLALAWIGLCTSQYGQFTPTHVENSAPASSSYLLGPGDEITIRCPEIEEITEKLTRIDNDGAVSLPLLGRFRISGLTVETLEQTLRVRLREFAYAPQVSVTVSQYGSQPVSIMGAVQAPGTFQLRGQKALLEVISMGGGLRPDAGHELTITRRLEWGELPLPNAHRDPTGKYIIGTVDVQAALAGKPDFNIFIQPFDVIFVPRAQLVYALGEVKKPGGFALTDGKGVTVLQVLALAEGLSHTAKPKAAKIIRPSATRNQKEEIPLDLANVMEGRAPDLGMRPEDILIVPSNKAKSAALRALDAIIQTGTGIAIYRR